MDINALKNNANAKKFSDGHVIANENDKSNDEMYVVLEGNVSLYRNYNQPNEAKIKNIGTGNFFGEMSLFLQKERTETAVAVGDVILFAVSRSSAFEFFQTQPQLTGLLVKTLCQELDNTRRTLLRVAASNKTTPHAEEVAASAPAPSAPISDTPPPGFISDTPPAGFVATATAPASLPDELFPEGHQVYEHETQSPPPELIYKRTFKCPVCDEAFQAYTVRTTRLKLEKRDKDFRSHYIQKIDPTYYEIVTCTKCWFSNFESAYSQPIIARFKENIGQITTYKTQIGLNLIEDRSINAVFAGYYLALKGAPLFYKSPEMFIAKIWLRLMWLYDDVEDAEMQAMSAKKAHSSYLSAFESTDATPDALQQLCVLMGELSLIVKDVPNAKIFFVKARSNKGGSKVLLSQAEDGIETIRKIEAGQIRL
ncbi:MAG: DUF2225 domain-containing protein [Defluviitaleaceae bacterium]|nr:DUF2225 domain-containing protein [Defluviitaleaceae bacterium]